MDSKDPSTREGAVIEVANVGRGRERPVVGGNERLMRDQDWRPAGQEAHDTASTPAGTERRATEPTTDEPEPASVTKERDAAGERKPSSGYARRPDRVDPGVGLGATQSGERQSHDLPGVGNRPARAMSQSGARISDFDGGWDRPSQ